MEFANLNWIAVILGAIAAFLLGWLVYSPMLFGEKWAKGSGVELNTASKMPVFAMIAQLFALFTLSIIVGAATTASALIMAIFAIFAAALFVVSNGGFCRKSNYAMSVDFGYVVAAGTVMIAAQNIF